MIPSPPSEEDVSSSSASSATSYSRPSPSQAAADAIPFLVASDNTYHLFHLSTPPHTTHHPPRLRSTWSRLRSKDLVTWTRDPKPVISHGTNEETDPDVSGAWTGCVVAGPDGGNMNLFYTGYSLPRDGKQVVLRVAAEDEQGSFFDQTNCRHTPIQISDSSPSSRFEDVDFRDPYVFFNDHAGEYWMLVATRLREGPYWTRGCIALLTSQNLQDWTMQPEPLYAPNDMFCPECPELFPLPNGKWYLVYSRFGAPDAGTVYRIGDSPRGPFRTPRDGSRGRLDGRRWYAAKSCPKAGDPAKRVYFGWIADYCEDDGKWLWGGDLGVPREVFADGDDGHLRVQPAKEILAALRSSPSPSSSSSSSSSSLPSRLHLSSTSTTIVEFPSIIMDDAGVAGGGKEKTIALSIDISRYDAASFGFVLAADPHDSSQSHRLRLSKVGGQTWTVVLFTDRIPLDDFWADQYNVHIPRAVDGPEIVRHEGVNIDGPILVFLRGGLVECFVGGRSISYRIPRARNIEGGGVNGEGVKGVNGVNGDGPKPMSRRPFGLFVEDGEVDLDLSVLHGDSITRVV